MKLRRTPAAAAAVLGTTVLVLGTTGAPADAATTTKVYKGTAAMTVDVYDYCGGPWGGVRRHVGRAQYKVPATLVVSPTQKAGKQSEKNPFHFSLAAGGPRVNGSVSLFSSAVFRVSATDVNGHPRDPRLLLRYWSYTRSAKTGAFSGSLTNNHKAQGAVLNTFNAANLIVPCRPSLGVTPVMPHTINAGARISGKITSAHAQATVTGSTYDGFYVFRMVFKK
ncbi:hypothetical protein [Peterkaempfera sp. SMS 1(5)a]|uniref:hypothetical protein n=1 Tax=Peterkaempfera podocarpi TaxID=3232308 RepID=UPI00366CEDDB